MNPRSTIEFQQNLLSWYATEGRELPWRKTRDPYAIWLSEIMLQQTQVTTVIPYYNRFLKKFPTLTNLAEADLQDVLKIWEGLGYYTRARNLHKAAIHIAKKYNGAFPKDYPAILGLPGIGDYTAAAICSIVYDESYPVVDGNVKRVLSRIFQLSEPVNDSKSKSVFNRAADSLMVKEDSGSYNQAIMELGALVCKPRNPDCRSCPVKVHCSAYHNTTVSDYPKRNTKSPIAEYRIAVGVIRKKDKLLITRRKESGLLGGLWEFPGGKIHGSETPDEACVREIMEETGLTVSVSEHLAQVKHAYTHFKIVMDVFICNYQYGEIKLSGPTDAKWIGMNELDLYPFPGANRKFFPHLADALETMS